MSIRTYFIIAAVVALPFGVGFLLAPTFVASLFGAALDAPGQLMARFYGSLLIYFGLQYVLLRGMQHAGTARTMISVHLVANVLGLVLSLMGVLSGTINSMGWLIVLLYVALSLLSAYVLFAGQPMPVARSGAR